MEWLKEIIPDSSRVVTESIDEKYLGDTLGRLKGKAAALVFVQSTEEVSRILQTAHSRGIPVTPRGAGTNLVGSTVPVDGGIILDFSLMNKLLELDRDTMTVTVEPGILLQDLQRCVEDEGFFYPPDPGEKASTIGGNISTNAGGMRAVKYGVTRDYVRGLEVVLADGTIMTAGGKNVKDASGLSLKNLFIGSEGTLCVITKCILKLIPKPAYSKSALVPYPDLESGIRSVLTILRADANPTAVEFIQRDVVKLGEDFSGVRYPRPDAGSYILLTFDGRKTEVESALEGIRAEAMRTGALEFITLDDPDYAADIWKVRGALVKAVEATSEQEPVDIVVPISKTAEFIHFVRRINSIDYTEAVKMLAARAGMPEPQEDDKTGRMRSRILSMNKEAARFFHACLNSTVEEARQARAYWRRRGLDDKTIVRFGLGYAPNDGQALYQFLRDKGYNQQELDASGLFKRSPSGRIYCLFWKRVMTPIFDLRGNIIAFGGRVLDDSKPKYVNSPETLVYHKSDTVFALQIAKRSASRRFVLCEGYMDVISMQQAGIDTAVCACGTALTPDQVRLISEYADEVILSYDSDEAGQKATLRSLELFRNSPVKVGVLQIPGAKDPDEYIKKYGAERFKALLDGVGNALDFRLGRLRSQYDLSQDAQRLEYVKQAVDLLAERSSPTEQEVYAGRLAEETNISKAAIMTQLGTAVKKAGSKRRREHDRQVLRSGEMDQIKVSYTAGGSQALGIVSAQQRLLAAILREPRYLDLVQGQLTAEQFIQPQQKELYQAMVDCRQQGVDISLATLRAFVSEEALNELSHLAAQYSDVNCTPDDIRLYLDRIARGMPVASKAASMTNEELSSYFQSMREKKQGLVCEEE